MSIRYCAWSMLLVLMLAACERKSSVARVSTAESRQAKSLMQGVWVDDETDEVSFMAKGDTIFFTDSTSMPAYFRIVNDSLELGSLHYPVVKQSAQVFWFRNQTGDLVKLHKSDDPLDAQTFIHTTPHAITLVNNERQKRDSVVIYGGQRYHWYIAISPTRYRVTKASYNDDGVVVENVYYDNIIHISIYKGADKLYSCDFKKQMYRQHVPETFLNNALLGNMQFSSIDERGFHFDATICVPDGATCYMVSTDIDFKGQLTTKLIEY